jgi:hypothetical protein
MHGYIRRDRRWELEKEECGMIVLRAVHVSPVIAPPVSASPAAEASTL